MAPKIADARILTTPKIDIFGEWALDVRVVFQTMELLSLAIIVFTIGAWFQQRESAWRGVTAVSPGSVV